MATLIATTHTVPITPSCTYIAQANSSTATRIFPPTAEIPHDRTPHRLYQRSNPKWGNHFQLCFPAQKKHSNLQQPATRKRNRPRTFFCRPLISFSLLDDKPQFCNDHPTLNSTANQYQVNSVNAPDAVKVVHRIDIPDEPVGKDVDKERRKCRDTGKRQPPSQLPVGQKWRQRTSQPRYLALLHHVPKSEFPPAAKIPRSSRSTPRHSSWCRSKRLRDVEQRLKHFSVFCR